MSATNIDVSTKHQMDNNPLRASLADPYSDCTTVAIYRFNYPRRVTFLAKIVDTLTNRVLAHISRFERDHIVFRLWWWHWVHVWVSTTIIVGLKVETLSFASLGLLQKHSALGTVVLPQHDVLRRSAARLDC